MIRKFGIATLITGTVLLGGAVSAEQGKADRKPTPEEQAMMEAYQKAGTPGEQHKVLAATAGKYTVKTKMWSDPAAPPTEESGTATRTMALDGRVLVEEFKSTYMGAPFSGQGMTGFDNVSGKYWGTWTDNISTGVMVSEGTCDSKHNCTFTGSMNDAIAKGPVKMRMTSRWTTPKTEVFEMFAPGPDGKETKMMEITYTKM